MTTYCEICGLRIKLFKIRIKDGFICGPCQSKLPQKDYNRKEELTAEEIRTIVKAGEERDNARPDLLQSALKPLLENNTRKKDPAEEVRRYRDLRDEGLITDEEYERKRKELLKL